MTGRTVLEAATPSRRRRIEGAHRAGVPASAGERKKPGVAEYLDSAGDVHSQMAKHRTLVEHCTVLDVSALRRTGHVVVGASRTGVLPLRGRRVAYKYDGADGLRLVFENGAVQNIRVVSAPMPNGGYQLYADVGRRYRKLYLAPGADAFKSRSTLGLIYESHAVGGRKKRRALRARDIGQKLGPYGWTIRTKKMRTRDYMKLRGRLAELEDKRPGAWFSSLTRYLRAQRALERGR